jgi:hypothetical protein
VYFCATPTFETSAPELPAIPYAADLFRNLTGKQAQRMVARISFRLAATVSRNVPERNAMRSSLTASSMTTRESNRIARRILRRASVLSDAFHHFLSTASKPSYNA